MHKKIKKRMNKTPRFSSKLVKGTIRGRKMSTNYLEINQIYHGDCLELLKQIQPNSIALSFWSPPYHVGKQYEKGHSYSEWRKLITEALKLHFPILRPGAFVVV